MRNQDQQYSITCLPLDNPTSKPVNSSFTSLLEGVNNDHEEVLSLGENQQRGPQDHHNHSTLIQRVVEDINNDAKNHLGTMMMDPSHVSIETLRRQLNVLKHKSNIVAPPPPKLVDCYSQQPSSAGSGIDKSINDNTESLWKMTNNNSTSSMLNDVSGDNYHPTDGMLSMKCNQNSEINHNTTNIQIFLSHLQEQQQQIQSMTHQSPCGYVAGSTGNCPSDTSLLQQLLQSSNSQQQQMISQHFLNNICHQNNTTINNISNISECTTLNTIHSNMSHLLTDSTMNISGNNGQQTYMFSPSSHSQKSTPISHQQHYHDDIQINAFPQHFPLLKPVELFESSNNSSSDSTMILQQGSVEDMLQVNNTNSISPNSSPNLNLEGSEEKEKDLKPHKKKRTKTPPTENKPSKKKKENSNEYINTTISQQHPTDMSSFGGEQDSLLLVRSDYGPQMKSCGKFSRPLLKNETVLCENNKFKNNYFVFSGNPTRQGSKKKASTYSNPFESKIAISPKTTTSINDQAASLSTSPTGTDHTSMSSNQYGLNSNAIIIDNTQQQNSILPSSTPPQTINNTTATTTNKWTNFVSTLSDTDKRLLVQTIVESMMKQ